MGIAGKYNKTNPFTFKVPDSFGYYTLRDLVKQDGDGIVYPVNAIYINHKSRYGDAPVVATDSCLVNFPNHMTDTVEKMLSDGEVIAAINAGTVGFTIYGYSTQKAKGTFYSVTWVDIEK